MAATREELQAAHRRILEVGGAELATGAGGSVVMVNVVYLWAWTIFSTIMALTARPTRRIPSPNATGSIVML